MESIGLTSYRTATTFEASIGISGGRLGGVVSIAVVLRGCTITATTESALISQGDVV
jgi:hypothetical protein